MSTPVTPAQAAIKNALDLGRPYVWLFEFQVPTTPPERLRLAAHDTAVSYGTDGDGVPLVYSPYAVRLDPIEQNTDGDLVNLRVTVSNVKREIMALVEAHGAFVGQPATMQLVHLDLLSDAAPLVFVDGKVASASATVEALVFEVGLYYPSRGTFPTGRISRDWCRFRYKGLRCGYAGALPSCDKSKDGTNGCDVHNNTARFGGFPGAPRRSLTL